MHRSALALLLLALLATAARGAGYEFAIAPRFENAFPFRNGLAPVQEGGVWGLIDTSGRFRVTPQYNVIKTASDRYWAVSRDGRWGFIDATGAAVVPLDYDDATAPADAVGTPGRALAAVLSDGKWRYIDMTNRLVSLLAIPQAEHYPPVAGLFAGGRAAVRTARGWGLLGEDGAFVPVPGALVLHRPAEGFSIARFDTGVGFVDMRGNPLGEAVYDQARPFSGGLAGVGKDGRWGFIDTAGRAAVGLRFAGVRDFSEGLAPALDAGKRKWGYIDTKGGWRIAPRFDRAYAFLDGVAIVRRANERGFIDRSGRFLVEPQFEDVWRFGNGMAPVRLNGKWGFIRLSAESEAMRITQSARHRSHQEKR